MPRFTAWWTGAFFLRKRGHFVRVNGKEYPCIAKMTVRSLLESLGHDPHRVAVEKNGQIVPRARFAEEPLCDTDTLEIVQFVGGG